MPFITEELYQALPGSAETIMTQHWPTVDDELQLRPPRRTTFEKVMDYIKAVRTMRTEMNVHPAKKTSMIIETADAAAFPEAAQVYLAKFAFATDVTFTDKYEGGTDGMVQVVHPRGPRLHPHDGAHRPGEGAGPPEQGKGQARKKSWPCSSNQLNNPKLRRASAPAALVEEIRNKLRQEPRTSWPTSTQSIKALG